MRAKLDSPRMASGRQIAACLTLVLVALSIAACGGGSPQGDKIPASRANDLITKLQEVEDRAADPSKACGDSNSAQTSLSAVSDSVDTLSDDNVDPDIVANLKELIGNVEQTLADQCSSASTTTASTPTEATSTETTTETTKETTDKSTTDKSTTDSTDETTTSSTESTTSTDTTNPPETSPPSHSNAGGNGNGNGGGSQGGFEVGGGGGRVPASGGPG